MPESNEDRARLEKLAEAVRIGGVHIYTEDGAFVIDYRYRGTRKCMCDALTLPAAIDAMDLDV